MFSEQRAWPGEYAATVGVFDGMHRGHQAILSGLAEEAGSLGVPSLVFTFHPRPVTVFAPGMSLDELTPAPRKWRLLAEAGIERVSVLRFSRAFAQIEPEDFVTAVLGGGDGLRSLWIGHDFRFGHRRRGDYGLLLSLGSRMGFRVRQVEGVLQGGTPISSTRIRERIRAGRIEEAADLLGRWPEIEGIVVTGRGQGARLLVPTANLVVPETQCLPATGVYAGEAEWDGTDRPAVMNLGLRPTLTAGDRLVPEVHVLDFDGSLVGKRLLFRMRRRLREERKFKSLDELRDQIHVDLDMARREATAWRGAISRLAPSPDSC